MVRQQPFEESGGEVFTEQEPFQAPARAKKRRAPGNGASAFLFFVGLALVGFGVAIGLPYVHEQSWQARRVDAWLTEFGLQHGALVLTGLVVFSLGFVTRAMAKSGKALLAATSSAEDSDFMLAADQLATDLAQVLSSLLQMSEELGALGEGQRTLLATQQHAGDGQGAESDQAHNAVFRLASSVDQLNARVSESFQGISGSFQALEDVRGRIDSLAGLVGAVRQSVDQQAARHASFEQQLAQVAEAAQHAAQAAASQPAPTPAPAPVAAAPQPAPVPAPAPQAAAPAPAPQPAPAPAPAPQAAAPAPQPAAPSPEPQDLYGDGGPLELDFSDVDESSLGVLDEMAGPGESGQQPAPPLPQSQPDALDALLPDDSVRRAIDEG